MTIKLATCKGLVVSLALAIASGAASAQTLTTLYSFTGGFEGSKPYAGLIADASGNLYGTTIGDGYRTNGTVFKLSPPATGGPWTMTVLQTFDGVSWGRPFGGLIADASGNLYGTTGNASGTNYGTVFRLSPSGGSQALLTFSLILSGDGEANSVAGLIADASGNLYGTTLGLIGADQTNSSDPFGQLDIHKTPGPTLPPNDGTVFKLSPPTTSGARWTETVLITFIDGIGSRPYAGLIADASGNLYGTTQFGGIGNNGNVFKLSPPTTSGAPWTETVLHSFTGGSDGSHPYADLIADAHGHLYGTTSAGGTSGWGTVFMLSPPTTSGAPWTETVLYSFNGSAGTYPYAGLIAAAAGNLYGTTVYGGPGGNGTVFMLSPPAIGGGSWTVTVLHSFTGGSDGGKPYAGLIADAHGHLYGTTFAGGTSGWGTVFMLSLPPVVLKGVLTTPLCGLYPSLPQCAK